MQRHARLAALLGLAVVSLSRAAFAGPVNVGDMVPPLTIEKWIKGEPIAKFEDDKTYVIDFWATWCTPCKATMPHLTELQAKYKDVIFIAQDVWEEEADRAQVEPFVKEMGDKMNVRIATDDVSKDKNGAMAAAWLGTQEQSTLPVTILISKAKVAWVGRPKELEPELLKVLNGTFDPAAAKADAAPKVAATQQAEVVQRELNDAIGSFLKAKDYAGAAKAIDGVIARHPDLTQQLRGTKLGILLLAKDYDGVYQLTDAIAADSDDNAEQLNALAWTIVDSKSIEKRDFVRAEKYATRAAELTENKEPAVLDTLARVHADQAHYDKAIEIESKAVELSSPDAKKDFQKTLDAYRAKKAAAPS